MPDRIITSQSELRRAKKKQEARLKCLNEESVVALPIEFKLF